MLLFAALARPDCVGIGIDSNEGCFSGAEAGAASGIANRTTGGFNDVLSVSPGEFDYILIRGDFIPAGMPERDALSCRVSRHLCARHGAIHQTFPPPESRRNMSEMRWLPCTSGGAQKSR